MITAEITGYGVRAALEEITRRNFIEAEQRLDEKMKPARLAPLAASDATLAELRGSSQSGLRNPNSR